MQASRVPQGPDDREDEYDELDFAKDELERVMEQIEAHRLFVSVILGEP